MSFVSPESAITISSCVFEGSWVWDCSADWTSSRGTCGCALVGGGVLRPGGFIVCELELFHQGCCKCSAASGCKLYVIAAAVGCFGAHHCLDPLDYQVPMKYRLEAS